MARGHGIIHAAGVHRESIASGGWAMLTFFDSDRSAVYETIASTLATPI
jgi:hypothetical protein